MKYLVLLKECLQIKAHEPLKINNQKCTELKNKKKSPPKCNLASDNFNAKKTDPKLVKIKNK